MVLVGAIAFIQAGSDPYVEGSDSHDHDATHVAPNTEAKAPTMDELDEQVGGSGDGPMQKPLVAPSEKFGEKRDPTMPAGRWYDGGRPAKSGKELMTGGKTE